MTAKFINSFLNLPQQFYSDVEIDSFENPSLIHLNTELLQELELNYTQQEALQYFSGNKKIPNSHVVSTVYSGHQFGSYVKQLGDGRAHLLGEVENSKGQTFELQIKGSGKTPYSRFGDGKAVLRSSIREYLASEALHHLGIPTTRALCLIGSDESVMREGIETAAMVTRVSPSFIRFGHFEYFTHSGKPELTKKLIDYTIDKFFPRLSDESGSKPESKYEKFFYEITLSTAKLMAKWQAFGFAHGVMNTDNMSILGLTIDYGPYGFLDSYQPGFIPNHSDYTGRYAFANQPNIAMWNLQALAYALSPVINPEQAMEIINLYKHILIKEFTNLMRKKLGFSQKRNSDEKLIQDLLVILGNHDVDYTIFMRKLGDYKIGGDNSYMHDLFKNIDAYKDWEVRYVVRLKQEGWSDLNRNKKDELDSKRCELIKQSNPKYILRNYMAENAIRNATYAQDFSEINKLVELLINPFDEQPENENYFSLPPDWSSELNISCSS